MLDRLPRRERDAYEALCRLKAGTAAAVRAELGGDISDSAVRTLLVRLEAKGLVARRAAPSGIEFRPADRSGAVAEGALRRMVDTFFAGSAVSAAQALLGLEDQLTSDEADALKQMIDRMEGEGR